MIAQNVALIRRRIAAACSRAGRDPASVDIVCASKGRSAGEITETLAAGLGIVGENRVQEALVKYRTLADARCAWHFIGHLQTNKARDAVRIFDLIHSVDSLKLVQEIDRQAQTAGKVQDILIEVNTSNEESKFGIRPEGLADLARSTAALEHVRCRGLMTMAPVSDDPHMCRSCFCALRQLLPQVGGLQNNGSGFILSMGMTDDFETAIEEGANLVRLGRAIFEGA
jgi:PLP dependent protein